MTLNEKVLATPIPINNFENKIFQITKIKNRKKWTNEDDAILILLAEKYKEKHWKEISRHFNNKNPLQCFSRYKRVRPGIIKGSWTKEEDDKIVECVMQYGKSWSKIAKIITTRNGKQIRDRYTNALDPYIKKGKFSDDEDKLLIKLYISYGAKWSIISKSFPNRTADMVKNRFHSSIKKIFFTQETITRKTKLMQSLKEKKLSAMNENFIIQSLSQNFITNDICFSLKSTTRHDDLQRQVQPQIEIKKDNEHNTHTLSNSRQSNNINNCSSSFEEMDFFSINEDNLFSTNDFFNQE